MKKIIALGIFLLFSFQQVAWVKATENCTSGVRDVLRPKAVEERRQETGDLKPVEVVAHLRNGQREDFVVVATDIQRIMKKHREMGNMDGLDKYLGLVVRGDVKIIDLFKLENFGLSPDEGGLLIQHIWRYQFVDAVQSNNLQEFLDLLPDEALKLFISFIIWKWETFSESLPPGTEQTEIIEQYRDVLSRRAPERIADLDSTIEAVDRTRDFLRGMHGMLEGLAEPADGVDVGAIMDDTRTGKSRQRYADFHALLEEGKFKEAVAKYDGDSGVLSAFIADITIKGDYGYKTALSQLHGLRSAGLNPHDYELAYSLFIGVHISHIPVNELISIAKRGFVERVVVTKTLTQHLLTEEDIGEERKDKAARKDDLRYQDFEDPEVRRKALAKLYKVSAGQGNKYHPLLDVLNSDFREETEQAAIEYSILRPRSVAEKNIGAAGYRFLQLRHK